MAACKSVVVLCPNARRQTVKVGPTTTILQILEEVCKKQGLSCQEYAIKHQRKILDETLPIRYSGLSNNAHLEVVIHTKTTKKDAPCTIALQLPSGERLLKDFPPQHSLWDVIMHWNSQEDGPHHQKLTGEKGQEVVCVYMTQRVSAEHTLKNTTLHSLGLTGKRAIIRLLHEASTSDPAVSEPEKSSIQKETDSSCQSTPETNIQTQDRQQSSGIEGQQSSGIEGQQSSGIEGQQSSGIGGQTSNVHQLSQNRHRQLDSKTVSPDRAARDPKRTKIAGPDPLFPDFKFPDRPAVKASEPQTPIVTEERLHYLATPCERCPVVFKEDDQSLTVKDQDMPDSFYDVTIEDLRKMLQGLQSERVKSEDMPLLTKAMRESRRLEEMCKYERVVIRVKFPDRFALQSFFRPQEKVSTLFEFVKSHLQDPEVPFYLYTTPPRTELNNKNGTLFEAHLCPASLVYFGCKEKKDHFLSDNLLSNVVTALDAEKAVLDSGIRGSGVSRPSTDDSEHCSNSSMKNNNTSDTTDKNTTTHANNSVPPPGGSGGKVPKWFKGVGK